MPMTIRQFERLNVSPQRDTWVMSRAWREWCFLRVIIRLFDQNLADKARDGFNITTVMSQSAISAPTFVVAAVEESIVSSMVINDELLVQGKYETLAELRAGADEHRRMSLRNEA